MDTTEARYAAIARTMATSGDWVTPWFPDGNPFWGKPPLAFWLSAVGFNTLGINEFAARLPHWIMAVLVIVVVWDTTARWSRDAALYAVTVLSGSLLFFGLAGSVTTDMALTAGVAIAMRGVLLGLHGASEHVRRRESLLLFVGLGIGLLAKGPIVLVLVFAPLLVWMLLSRETTTVLRGLPWLRGALLTLAIALPWYLMAELRTPGFLRYFIVGEHIMRFLVPGWEGDLYGSAHDQAYGTIWVFLFLGILPWAFVLPVLARRRDRPSVRSCGPLPRPIGRLLLIWALIPAVFFTFSANILATYALPGLPPLAILAGAWLVRHADPARVRRALALGIIVAPLIPLTAVGQILASEGFEANTEKYLVQAYKHRRTGSAPLVYVGERPFSAAFYSGGDAGRVDSLETLAQQTGAGAIFVAASRDSEADQRLRGDTERIGVFGDFALYRRAAAP